MDASVVLRAGAVVLTSATFAAASRFTLDHPKNADAPLQPPAAEDVSLRAPSASSSAAPSATARPRTTQPPRITLQPGVRATALPGITYTHVS